MWHPPATNQNLVRTSSPWLVSAGFDVPMDARKHILRAENTQLLWGCQLSHPFLLYWERDPDTGSSPVTVLSFAGATFYIFDMDSVHIVLPSPSTLETWEAPQTGWCNIIFSIYKCSSCLMPLYTPPNSKEEDFGMVQLPPLREIRGPSELYSLFGWWEQSTPFNIYNNYLMEIIHYSNTCFTYCTLFSCTSLFEFYLFLEVFRGANDG